VYGRIYKAVGRQVAVNQAEATNGLTVKCEFQESWKTVPSQ
jgi:hypothetical protein